MAAEPVDESQLPSNRLRQKELGYGIAAGVALVATSVVLLVKRTGPGAPAHPTVLWPVIALVAGVAMLISLPRRNRLLSASLGFAGAFVVSFDKTPNSVAGVKTAGFLLPALFAFLVFYRQSRQDRATRMAKGTGARRGEAAAAATTAKPVVGGRGRPTGRYTPPKDRTPPPAKGRRR